MNIRRGGEKLDGDGKPSKGLHIRGAETIKAKAAEPGGADHREHHSRPPAHHHPWRAQPCGKVFRISCWKNPDSDLWEIDAKTTRKSRPQDGAHCTRYGHREGRDTIAAGR